MLRVILGSVAELADALDLGSSTVRCAGSIPVTPIGPRPIESRQEKVESRKIQDPKFS